MTRRYHINYWTAAAAVLLAVAIAAFILGGWPNHYDGRHALVALAAVLAIIGGTKAGRRA